MGYIHLMTRTCGETDRELPPMLQTTCKPFTIILRFRTLTQCRLF